MTPDSIARRLIEPYFSTFEHNTKSNDDKMFLRNGGHAQSGCHLDRWCQMASRQRDTQQRVLQMEYIYGTATT